MNGPPRKRRRRWMRWGAAGLLGVVVALASLALWLVLTESGLRAAVQLAEAASGGRIAVTAPAGRLAGPLRLGALRVELPDLRLRASDLELEWDAGALLEPRLEIARLGADTLDVSTRPGEEPAPAVPPESLELPFPVSVDALRIGRLRMLVWTPVPEPDGAASLELSGLSGAFHSDGRHHRFEAAGAGAPFGRARLSGEIDGRSPFPLSARGTVEGEREGYPYVLALTAEGDLIEPRVHVDAQGAGLSGEADMVAAPFATVPLRSLRAAVGELDPSAFLAGAPRAALRIEADLQAESADPWTLVGPVTVVNRAPATLDENGLPFERLAAQLRWTPVETVVDGLDLRTPGGGRLSGALTWRPEAAPDAIGRLSAALALAGIDVHRLDGRLPSAVLSGSLEAEGDAARQEARVDLRLGKARVQGQGSVELPAQPDAPRSFSAAGELSRFDPSALVAEAPSADLNLSFETEGRLAASPDLTAAWRLRPSRLEGRALEGEGRVRVAGERLADVDVDMTLAGNRLVAEGAWGTPGDALEVEVDAPALGALHDELAGRARLDATLTGTRSQPGGTLRLFAERLVLPGGTRVAGLNAEGQLEAGLDGPFELALGLSGVGPEGEPAWLDAAALAIDGRRGEHRIELDARGAEGDTLRARLAGALSDDPLRWTGELVELESEGRFAARLTEPAELVAAADRVALGRAVLDAGEQGRIRLEETVWTPERIAARGNLTGLAFGLTARPEGRPRRGPGPLVLGAEWDLRLTDSAEGELRVFRESGDLTVTGEIGTRLGLEHLEALLTARDNRLALSFAARGTELGELSGSATALAERDADGGWGLAEEAPLLGSAHLDMPSIAWAGRLMQENLVTDGSLQADLTLAGTPAEPRASGRIAGSGLSIVLVDEGLHLRGGELLAEFDRDRLRLARLEFVSPNRVRPDEGRIPFQRLTDEPGRLTASGEIALDSGEGDFSFRAERLPLLQRPDRWMMLSGEGRGTSTWSSVEIDARMHVDAGYIELAETPPPSLSEDVVIVGQEEPGPGALKVTADVAVALGDHLYLSALGVDTRLTGTLQLRLREGEPLRAIGTVETVGGTFSGYGQQLSLERGIVNFQGPLDNPGLNVVALRKGLAVEAGVAITGSVRRPQVRLVSEPSVPDPEKLSWIVLGRPPAAGSGADLGVLLPAARALLGKPGGGGMTEQLSRSLGFDELSIGQGELGSVERRATSRVVGEGSVVTGEGTVSGQVLTLGKRLSSDLFLSFEQSLGGAERLIKLTYQLTRRVSVVARSGTYNSADIYYTISFK